MKRCSIPPSACRHRDEARCCKDCREKDCKVKCLNSPERCRCWVYGPPPQKRATKGRAFDWDEMARLYGQGLTQAQVAEQLGCHAGTVSAALNKMGVTKRGQA